MIKSHDLGNGSFLVNIDSNDDVEELVAFTKANPGKQIYLSVGEELTPEMFEARMTAQSDPLDFGCLESLLIGYKALGGHIVNSKHCIPPTPSHNPKAGRYGQPRHKGKHR